MAIYHLSVKPVKRSDGKSVIATAAYRAREKLKDERQNLTFNYSNLKKDLAHAEILTPKNAPNWMKDREKLWNRVEAVEKRKDARLAREVLIAIPKELNIDQNKNLVREFAKIFVLSVSPYIRFCSSASNFSFSRLAVAILI